MQTHYERRMAMESIEISAKTEEEAVALALADLGLSRSEVDVVVIKKGKTGIFGFGSEEVRVRVTPRQQPPGGADDISVMAKEALDKLLSLMGVSGGVEPAAKGVADTEHLMLDIKGEDLGILIGRRGETLSALQYLVNLIVSRRVKGRVGVVVDVEGYRERRYESLRLLARRLGEQVKTTGRAVTLEPMPANERRIIHLELKDNPDVTTESMGQGEERKIVIKSKGSSEGKEPK
jgi:spoIIIJ-associated protein